MKLTTAERTLLRRLKADSNYRPSYPKTKKRWADLIARGVLLEKGDTVVVHPDAIPKKVTYFIQEEETEYVKVGVCTEVESRLAGIQVGNPRQLILVGFLEGDKERAVQHAYQHCRVRGEWFTSEVLEALGQDFKTSPHSPKLPASVQDSSDTRAILTGFSSSEKGVMRSVLKKPSYRPSSPHKKKTMQRLIGLGILEVQGTETVWSLPTDYVKLLDKHQGNPLLYQIARDPDYRPRPGTQRAREFEKLVKKGILKMRNGGAHIVFKKL